LQTDDSPELKVKEEEEYNLPVIYRAYCTAKIGCFLLQTPLKFLSHLVEGVVAVNVQEFLIKYRANTRNRTDKIGRRGTGGLIAYNDRICLV
jgi:hypothetical protein